MAYCTPADVAVLLQIKIFDVNSQPSLAQCTDIIDQTAAEMNDKMSDSGVALPVTDSNKLLALKKINVFGAAGYVGLTYGRNTQSVNGGVSNWFYSKYEKLLSEFIDRTAAKKISAQGRIKMSNDFTDGITTESDQKWRENVKY